MDYNRVKNSLTFQGCIRVSIQVEEAILHVQGMKCAGCVQAVEKALGQREGVVSASVNLVTEKATIAYRAETISASGLAIALTDLGFPTQVESPHPSEAKDSSLQTEAVRRLGQIGLAMVLVALSSIGHLHEFTGLHLPILGELWFHWGLATIALAIPGRVMAIDGALSLKRGIPNMNTLVSLGAWTAYLASNVALVFPQIGWECFFDAPVMIVGLVLLGRTLEEQARGRATASFKALLSLQPAIARRVLDPLQDPIQSEAIPVDRVGVGTFLQVLPGDKFPVDGVIQSGQSSANEAMLTGESRPVEKGPGDLVMAGTLNQSAAVVMEATRTGSETALAQIVQCVEAAQARKAPIQRIADRVSGYFVYGVMAIAALTFCFWAAIGTHLWPEVLHYAGSATHAMPAETNPDRLGLLLSLKLAIAVLVVACPCALGLATPTAIVVGTSLGAERGLLIRGGDVLEAVHHLDTIAFDKTGTLTTGNPVVATYWSSATMQALETPEQLIQLAASLETNAQHPFAEAILAKAAELQLERFSVTDWSAHLGFGLSGEVDGKRLHLGSLAWLAEQGVEVGEDDLHQADALAAQGLSIVFLAVNGRYGGGIALQDPLRPDAVEAIATLRQQKLKVLMLTGDRRATAEAIGHQLGLKPEEIYAAVSPTDKAKAIQALQAEGKKVGMVGDGINDAPALVQADVGIALSSGTDVAIETAQIVLMHRQLAQQAPRLGDVGRALKLSSATFRTIQQNLFWALGYNLLGIPLAAGVFLPAFGILLNPAMAAALMAFSSVSVVTNALTLRGTKLT
ncbi:heavy metal translocating P-type ATPase [Altericista sp. CCNU0014]|uniref:heavy metal translocating P-type ATPase n=1 Tax=Altericista sp. CCNU0014 TaxID=3082949 RepID=UPI00384C6236